MDPREWMEDAKTFHYRALSNPKDEEHTKDIYQAWVGVGVYDEVAMRLGYRYRILQSRCPELLEGASFELQLTIHNDGWGRPVNPRRVEVILRNTDSGVDTIIPIDPPEDFRLWFPDAHEQTRIRLDIPVPALLPDGLYQVLLNLPDPEASLHSNPAYSIRLASLIEGQPIWEPMTGFNRLGHLLKVVASRSATD
jgi:hypothetical protein